jgi:hypothetical protein
MLLSLANTETPIENPKREQKKFFCKKKFLLLSEEPRRGSSQRANQNFFAKNFGLLSFRVFGKGYFIYFTFLIKKMNATYVFQKSSKSGNNRKLFR